MSNLVNDFEVRKETLRALGGDPTGLSNIFEVDKEILRLTQQGGGGEGIPDAPIDGVQYARQDGEWTPVESGIDWNTIKQKLAEDGVESIKFIMGAEEIILTASEVKTLINQTVLPDAPLDGQQYARQNGEWTPVQTPTVEKYMTITVDESNTEETIIRPNVTGSLPNLNLQYRINNGEWSDFIVGTTADIKVVAGDVVQFKGVNPNGISNYTNYSSNYLNFGISGNTVALSGNVMSLIDGVGDSLVIPNNYCFYKMFMDSKVKTVSYDFLPAKTLKYYCYGSMFFGCKSLVNAPELPATNLNSYCYYSMFQECDSLVTAPELPATTLAPYCYNSMFSGCDSLVTAPELNATKLEWSCYDSMFTFCIKLKYLKCLASEGTINDDGTVPSALDNWLFGVSSTGTFVKPDGVVYGTGSSGIPEGWTVKESDMIEVPKDGNQYARQNGNWVEVSKVKTTNNTTMQFWNGTQQEYDAIVTKDANTLYIIKEI